MSDHDGQQLTAREMVRAHAYPVLAAISTLSLVAIAVLQIPQAIRAHRTNVCLETLQAGAGSERKAALHCGGF